MTYIGGILAQYQNNANKSLSLIEYPVLSLSGKIQFKILQMKKNAQIIFGAIPKKVYESMNEKWDAAKLNQDSFALGNDGFRFGWHKN